jgi:hypothetical protein
MQCLVVNNNESIRSEDYFRVFVASVFSDQNGEEIVNPLVDYLKIHSEKIGCADDLYSLIRVALKEKMVSCINQEDLCALLDRAESLTQSNKSAYATRQKNNAYNQMSRYETTAIQWPGEVVKSTDEYFALEPYIQKYPIIDKDTAILSAGSCFASGIGRELVSRGFNYPIEEPVLDDSLFSNCRWGAIYNIPSLKQLVLLAKGKWKHPQVLWSIRGTQGLEYWDPFRENIKYTSLDEAALSRAEHQRACARAFAKADVFVITLGMTEAWKMRSENSYFSRCPWRLSPHLVEPVDMSVSQCVFELETLLAELKEIRPDIKIVVTVSPIPLSATFRVPHSHVVEASCLSKSRLRVAAEEFSGKHRDCVYYFPSYEKVMYCTRDAWATDFRHLRDGVFSGVVDMFMNMYYRE